MRYNLHEITGKLVQEAGFELRLPDSQASTHSTLPQFQQATTFFSNPNLSPSAVPAWSLPHRRGVRPHSGWSQL